MKRLVIAGVLLALLVPAQAFAHATLLHTSPGFRERLATSPPKVTLRFDQYVKALPGSVQLFSATHALPVSHVRSRRSHPKASLPRLQRGAYTVRWHALSDDGHVVSGVFTFGVLRYRTACRPRRSARRGRRERKTPCAGLYFLALALVVGGLGFRLLVLRRRL